MDQLQTVIVRFFLKSDVANREMCLKVTDAKNWNVRNAWGKLRTRIDRTDLDIYHNQS